MLEGLMSELQPLIVSACVTILTAVASYVGTQIKKVVIEKINTEEKRKVVETTCRYVNQLYKDLDGPSKFEKAKENVLLQLNEKGIGITELELEVLIESTVNSFKQGFTETKPVITQNTTPVIEENTTQE